MPHQAAQTAVTDLDRCPVGREVILPATTDIRVVMTTTVLAVVTDIIVNENPDRSYPSPHSLRL